MRIERVLFFFILCISAGLALLGWYSYMNIEREFKLQQQHNASYLRLRAADDLLSSLQDVEIGSRGYALSGDTDFLQPYYNGQERVQPAVQRLIGLIPPVHGFYRQRDSLWLLAAQRLSIAATLIDLRNKGVVNSTAVEIEKEQGKFYMDQMRRLIAGIKASEAGFIDNYSSRKFSSDRRFWMSFYSILGGAVMLVVIALLLSRKHIYRRRTAEERVRWMNHKLEERVHHESLRVIEGEQRFRNVLDNMLEGAQILNANWEYVYVNDAAAQHGKSTKEELMGMSMIEKYPGIETTALFDKFRICMAERRPMRFENEFQYPDGSTGYFEISCEPIPEGMFILSIDISERKKRIEEWKQRVKENREILYRISHQMRQPVVQIQGIAHVFENIQLSQDDLQQMASLMKDAANLLDRQTKELTDFVNHVAKRVEP